MVRNGSSGENYHYNEYVVIWVGGPSAALMKRSVKTHRTQLSQWMHRDNGHRHRPSACAARALHLLQTVQKTVGCLVLSFIESWSIAAFLLALFLAGIDWAVLIVIVPILPHPDCSVFGCFTTETFRQYWGISNMLMNLLSTLLTLV